MRWMLLLLTLGATGDPGLIDELDECVQLRFQTLPAPLNPAGKPVLGMSRIAVPSSFGQHFMPKFISKRDFEPETDREKAAVAKLESEGLQVGFYLVGPAILNAEASALNPRALKGPGVMTAGTPRPLWYPLQPSAPTAANALPDWREIYPVAQRAMRSFADGGHGFQTALRDWHIAARPVAAEQQKCLACHADRALHSAVGGVLYAYRRTR